MSMADAAPMLSTTPRGSQSQLGSAFQDGDGAFDAGYSKAAGTTAGGGSRGGSSSVSRKPGRYAWETSLLGVHRSSSYLLSRLSRLHML